MIAYLVYREHNRYGPCLDGLYGNRAAAEAHKSHLDATQNGWDNFAPGCIEEQEILIAFVPPSRGQQP